MQVKPPEEKAQFSLKFHQRQLVDGSDPFYNERQELSR
jgi:hypothetical protein